MQPNAVPVQATSRAAVARAFGRFELRDLLGRSRRTMLWSAFDAEAGEDRLVTLPRVAPADAAALALWLSHARQAARLSHPNLAAVVEVGVHEHWPYIVNERTSHRSLTEYLAMTSMPGHNELAGWFCQVLEGLAFAHEAGIAHEDLQLHCLLIDERGRVSVAGLGAGSGEAAVVPSSALDASRGMPMDPAGLRAQRGAAERDVLAVGLLAHGCLIGSPALDEPDIGLAIDRLAPDGRDALRLPWTTPLPISDPLRTIVNRTTHAQPRQRYLNARTLLRALDGWREADAKDDGGAVALLLDRLSSVGHFPAMPGIALTVARLSRMEKQRVDEMAEQVLLDLALSFEMLRLVNSAQVQGSQVSGNGPVLTIRRAITMVGVDGVRAAAGALRAWPGPLSEARADTLRQLVQRVRLAGHVAQALRPAGYDGEVVFLLTVLQNLGRLMLAYHFPDDAEQITQLMRPLPVSPNDTTQTAADRAGMPEQAAAYAVLGTDVDALSAAVARHWGLVDEVVVMMRRLPTDRPVHKPDADGDLLRATASAANELVDALHIPLPAQVGPAIEAVAKRYARVLDVGVRDLTDAVRIGRESLASGAASKTGPATSEPASRQAEPGSQRNEVRGVETGAGYDGNEPTIPLGAAVKTGT